MNNYQSPELDGYEPDGSFPEAHIAELLWDARWVRQPGKGAPVVFQLENGKNITLPIPFDGFSLDIRKELGFYFWETEHDLKVTEETLNEAIHAFEINDDEGPCIILTRKDATRMRVKPFDFDLEDQQCLQWLVEDTADMPVESLL